MDGFLSWLFISEPTDPKYQTFLHPFFSFMLSFSLSICISIVFTNLIEKVCGKSKAEVPEWSRKYLWKLLSFYLFFMISSRFATQGTFNFIIIIEFT